MQTDKVRSIYAPKQLLITGWLIKQPTEACKESTEERTYAHRERERVFRAQIKAPTRDQTWRREGRR